MKPTGKPRYRFSLITGLWMLTDWRYHNPPNFPMTLKASK